MLVSFRDAAKREPDAKSVEKRDELHTRRFWEVEGDEVFYIR